MTTSSVQPSSFEWLNNNSGFISQDVISIDTSTMANISAASGGTGNITISNTTGSSYYYTGSGIGGLSGSTITISNGGSSGTVLGGAGSPFTWKNPEEFVDCLPEFNRIKDMCEQYPGLKIAFEKFKTTYQLVQDHYDTPEDQRPLP